MPVIIKRPRARADLAESWSYLADDSEARADAFVEAVDRKVHALAGRPNRGRARDELAEGWRSFAVGRYVIFYRALPKGVEIVRVVQSDRLDALTMAAEGGKSDKAKPFKGVEGGVFAIALRYRGDAFRTLYTVKSGADIWVIHAFQKQSKSGIKTPHREVDLIRERLKRLKEALK